MSLMVFISSYSGSQRRQSDSYVEQVLEEAAGYRAGEVIAADGRGLVDNPASPSRRGRGATFSTASSTARSSTSWRGR